MGFSGAKVELTFTAVDHGIVVETPKPEPVKKKQGPVGQTVELPPMPPKEELEARFAEVAVCFDSMRFSSR